MPEPFIIKYFYTIEKRYRNYLPDVIITYKSEKTILVELKPEYRLEEQKNIDKFVAAREYCEKNNITFEVWTEKTNPYGILG